MNRDEFLSMFSDPDGAQNFMRSTMSKLKDMWRAGVNDPDTAQAAERVVGQLRQCHEEIQAYFEDNLLSFIEELEDELGEKHGREIDFAATTLRRAMADKIFKAANMKVQQELGEELPHLAQRMLRFVGQVQKSSDQLEASAQDMLDAFLQDTRRGR